MSGKIRTYGNPIHHNSFSNPSVASPTSTTYSPTLPSLYLCHSSFSIPSIALPTSQLILQPFCCFTYVTDHSSTLLSLLLCQGFHLRHLASRPWNELKENIWYKIRNISFEILQQVNSFIFQQTRLCFPWSKIFTLLS